MKKYSLFIGFLLCTFLLYAQEIRVGAMAGWHKNRLVSGEEEYTDFKSRNGWESGIFADVQLKRAWGIRTRLSYTSNQFGYGMADNVDGDFGYSGKIKLDYTRLALLAKCGVGNTFRLDGYWGFGLKLLTDSRHEYQAGGITAGAGGMNPWGRSYSESIRNQLHPLVADMEVGVEFSYVLFPKCRLSGGANLEYDLSKINKKEGLISDGDILLKRMKLLTLGVYVGLSFTING